MEYWPIIYWTNLPQYHLSSRLVCYSQICTLIYVEKCGCEIHSRLTKQQGNYLNYSLSCKTGNVYCFTTNQMRDETAKDNRQTAAEISHNLIRKNELALSSMRNLQFSLCISPKKLFSPQTNTSDLIPSYQKKNYWVDLKVSANCKNLQQYRFASWVKVSQLQRTTNHSQLAWPVELHM